jgi:hypothetical protein
MAVATVLCISTNYSILVPITRRIPSSNKSTDKVLIQSLLNVPNQINVIQSADAVAPPCAVVSDE